MKEEFVTMTAENAENTTSFMRCDIHKRINNNSKIFRGKLTSRRYEQAVT